LEAWKNCLATKKQHIDAKQFDKFWVSIYQRYDCCTCKEQKQAARKCGNEASMAKGIWDFSHLSLSDFKDFIGMFKKITI